MIIIRIVCFTFVFFSSFNIPNVFFFGADAMIQTHGYKKKCISRAFSRIEQAQMLIIMN